MPLKTRCSPGTTGRHSALFWERFLLTLFKHLDLISSYRSKQSIWNTELISKSSEEEYWRLTWISSETCVCRILCIMWHVATAAQGIRSCRFHTGFSSSSYHAPERRLRWLWHDTVEVLAPDRRVCSGNIQNIVFFLNSTISLRKLELITVKLGILPLTHFKPWMGW